MKVCKFPKCDRHARFLMCWNNENGKHSGLVCATHDRELGRKNLSKFMPVQEAIVFERYLKETVDLIEYPDFPEWLEHRNLVGTIKSERPYDIEAEELRELNLPPRAFNALYRRQITVDELIDMSTEELMKIPWIGKDSATAIQKALRKNQSGPQSVQ